MAATITTKRVRAPMGGPVNIDERFRVHTQPGVELLTSERIDQFNREQAGLLCKVLCACPITVLAGVARLLQETADFLGEV